MCIRDRQPPPVMPGMPPPVPAIQPVGAWTTPQPPLNREPPPPDFGRPPNIQNNQPVRFDVYTYNAGPGREPMRMDTDPNYPRSGPAYEAGRNISGPPPELPRGDFGRGESNMPFSRPEEQRDRGRFAEDRPSWAERDASRPEGGHGPGWTDGDRPFGGRDSNDSRRDFGPPSVDQGMRAPDRWYENRNMGPEQGLRGPDYGPRSLDQGPRGSEYGFRGSDEGHRGPDYGPRGPDYGSRGPDRGPGDFMSNEGPPPRRGAMEPDDRYGRGRSPPFLEGSASRFGPSAGPDNRSREGSRPGFFPPEPRYGELPRPLMDKPVRPAPQRDQRWMDDERGYKPLGPPPTRFEGRPPSPPRGRHLFGDRFPPRDDARLHGQQDFDSRQMKETRDLCVCVTNLPKSFNFRETRRAFNGSRIPKDGIKLINDRMGMRTGVAFICFTDTSSLHSALDMNEKMVAGLRIKVERCTDADYDMAMDGAPAKPTDRSRSPRNRRPQGNPNISYFVLKKLPKKAEKEDIRQFLGKLRIPPEGGPFFELAIDKNRTGNALVAIEERDFGKVLKLHRSMLNGTEIGVVKIDEYEFEERSRRCRQVEHDTDKDVEPSATPGHDKKVEKPEPPKSKELSHSGNAENGGRQQSKSDSEPRSYCIEMRGVPYTAAPQLIQDFFRESNVPAESIYIVYNREHRATGIAFVEFTSLSDQQAALAKNKQTMAHRVINIRAMSKLAMEEEYNKQVQKFGGTPVFAQSSARPNSKQGMMETTLSMKNLHFDTQLEDILDFFAGYDPIVSSIKLQYRDQQPTGDGLVAFPTVQKAQAALRKNHFYLLGKPVTLYLAKK